MLQFNEHISSSRTTLFVEVVLPLSLAINYTYRVPNELNDEIMVGKRVVVQFGKSRIYTAIIYKISDQAPKDYEAKYLLSVMDGEPIIHPKQLKLWEWMAAYYLCNLGDVMNAALPAALKLASETKVLLDPNFSDFELLNEKELAVVDSLKLQNELSINDVSKLLGQKTVIPLIKSLIDKGAANVSEAIYDRYQPKVKTFLKLNSEYQEPENLRALFGILERAPKQSELLQAYLKLKKQHPEVAKKDLLELVETTSGTLNALIEKGIFSVYDKEISRFTIEEIELIKNFTLSNSQEKSLDEIKTLFQKQQTVLLHGVTASGKTQIYIRLIEDALNQGKQVLYLLPEIALTTQMITRLRTYFGSKIGIYHSKFNDNERAEIWQNVLNRKCNVVLGARSALFLPFSDLGLIIVDEEHESSYKQFDPSPRYHARDSAIYLASIHNCKVLLGSATPAIETYYNAQSGKYGLVQLTERFGGVELPNIILADVKQATKQKKMHSHFTPQLLDEISITLDRKEQVILFQNRRGYAPYLQCATCAHIPKCVQCDISLTYHKSSNKLHCHYCGYKQNILIQCPACGSTNLEQKGFGTEKIEDELSILLPNATIGRLDLDTTRSKLGYQQVLNNLEDRKIDVLVGTQMVSKGLDFDNVTLIGILSADSLLNYPDFRAHERSYQLMAQVSGRAGRRQKQGKVIIQTAEPKHKIIDFVKENNYEALYANELYERRQFHYPPFHRLIQVDVKHKEIEVLNMAAKQLSDNLRHVLGNRVLGPEFPLVNRIRNYYIKSILLKIEKEASPAKAKEILKDEILKLISNKNFKSIIISVDVDPA